MKTQVLSHQTLVDIAMQLYGTAEGAFALACENDLSVTDDLEPGWTLTYPIDYGVDKKVTGHYASYGLNPATAFINPQIVFDHTFDHTFRSFENNE